MSEQGHGDASARRSTASAEERFHARIGPTNANGCWPWKAGVMSNGYGSFYCREEQRTVLAHRYSYEREVGPIPEGMEIDHLCLNKLCVNPDHFEIVTPLINRRRGNAKLDVAAVLDIRSSSESGMTLARKYGVSKGAVHCVRSGRTWPGVFAETKREAA